jgi:predicted oxidoreductase
MMQDTLHWVIWTLGILVTGLGGFLAGYLKKKGENLAKKEDLDRLVKEVQAVTTTTKEIEAKISNDVWDRQKQWETRKEIVFETLRTLARARWILTDSIIAINSFRSATSAIEGGVAKSKLSKLVEQSNAMLRTLTEAQALIRLSSGVKVIMALGNVIDIFAGGTISAHDGEMEEVDKKRTEFTGAVVELNVAIRDELNMKF